MTEELKTCTIKAKCCTYKAAVANFTTIFHKMANLLAITAVVDDFDHNISKDGQVFYNQFQFVGELIVALLNMVI